MNTIYVKQMGTERQNGTDFPIDAVVYIWRRFDGSQRYNILSARKEPIWTRITTA
jgi:hypothetical protein